jgi:predicted dehydrogenase
MKEPNRREFLQQGAAAMAAVSLLPAMQSLGVMRLAEPLKVGLVGAGRQGRAILGELQKIENLEIAAICDIVEGRLRSGLRRAQGSQGFATHEEMLEKVDGLDAVFIATPTHEHRQIAVDCLQAGKHVYCEAPLEATVEDCQAIVKAARAAGTKFMTGMDNRSNPIYRLARTFVRTDAVRDLIALNGQYHRKTTWRSPARTEEQEKILNWQLNPEVSLGLAGEFGTHQFDAMSWFVNDYPVKARGTGAIRLYDDGREVADTIQCSLEYANGLMSQYEATICNSYGGRYENFLGSMAAVKLAYTAGWMFKEADAPTQGWEVYAFREQFHTDTGIVLIADATKLAAQGKLEEGVGLPNPPLYYALEDFIKSVVEDEPVVCSAEEGLRIATVAIKANEAITTGKEVEIDHDLFKVE